MQRVHPITLSNQDDNTKGLQSVGANPTHATYISSMGVARVVMHQSK